MAVIKSHLATLPGSPGVYRMLSERGDPLYVGKARNLRKRVATYASPAKLPVRLQRMVAATRSMEFVTTHTEVEALLLESNMIKKLRPRYNVLLRDDKSFPYVFITGDHAFPQVIKHRGTRARPGRYFGPFASAGAVNRTIVTLQRAFLLRNCSDNVFATRTRPCLQYQIKRCSAPCVDRISQDDYATLVEQAHEFLAGHSGQVQARLATEMQAASENLEFERAATLRDRIHALSQVRVHQDINVTGIDDADVIAVHQEAGQSCVQVFFFRDGRNYGNRAFFPSHARAVEPAEVITAFVGQFYDRIVPPKLVMVSEKLPESALLGEALSVRAGHRVRLLAPQRGARRKLIDHALLNAREALTRRMAESASHRRLMEGLADTLGMESPPSRIEVYDNSHIQGANAVGCMIVAGPDGFMKNAYRKFNIRGLDEADADQPGGDDYAMMREVLNRRFARALKEDPDREGGTWPDLVVIDGGRGQLSIAQSVFADLGIDDVTLLAIAKGPDRNAGREKLYMPDRQSFLLPPRDPVLYFLQRLRVEAHRFAIGTHRAKRAKGIAASPLDEISGVGAKRKRALLMHFGSAQAVAAAGLADLEAVDGISRAVAEKIYGFFNEE
ncbi:MAG: excinuclease ABC subunit UvrC [Alphaproteobacteria bacterium]|nr:excinuclease ABC subunit UvrC [Alphaproteobacteria bacterium]